jgi:hypothetical protein
MNTWADSIARLKNTPNARAIRQKGSLFFPRLNPKRNPTGTNRDKQDDIDAEICEVRYQKDPKFIGRAEFKRDERHDDHHDAHIDEQGIAEGALVFFLHGHCLVGLMDLISLMGSICSI